jgi:hypothetical protein
MMIIILWIGTILLIGIYNLEYPNGLFLACSVEVAPLAGDTNISIINKNKITVREKNIKSVMIQLES